MQCKRCLGAIAPSKHVILVPWRTRGKLGVRVTQRECVPDGELNTTETTIAPPWNPQARSATSAGHNRRSSLCMACMEVELGNKTLHWRDAGGVTSSSPRRLWKAIPRVSVRYTEPRYLAIITSLPLAVYPHHAGEGT